MKIDVSHIIEGWRNNLFPPSHLKALINVVSEGRMEMCSSCQWNSKNRKNYRTIRIDEHCSVCGCTLAALTKCLSCYCEQHKWEALITPEEDEIINNDDENI